ncbi:RNA polymerase sigma factor [Catalinimonas niigatensis]|uniref:RNA polymerase sigma factor n=1 Tax=Catalinimonas niigatensis TaxID=1397264 RepID=UPI0026667F06|nr:sigma-70 family RNA polymerase sigma factor [Catalinimonas niigatensis]WPP50766.1 sigma-70 family RNA polymerase sigma factor [Catalinimonas niigatensis]
MSIQPSEEVKIWKGFQKGDRKAFAQIYQAHFSALYNYGYRFCADESLAKEGVQELFVKLWNRKENLNIPASVRYYLIKSLRRTLLDMQKKQAKFCDLPENDHSLSEHSSEFLLIKERAIEEQNQFLEEAMDTLSKRQKEAIYLKFYENLSYEEVSSAMSLTVKSVYNLISKAVEVLRQNTPYVNLMLLVSIMP